MKTVNTIATVIAVSLLAGCGGGFEVAEDDMTFGSGSRSSSSTTGGGSSVDDEGEGGSLTGMDVTGGSTGSSTGNTGGTQTETGGTTSEGGSETGGDLGTGGRVTECVHYTCDEVTYMKTGEIVDDGLVGSACGAHDDGCGGVVICDTCDGDGFSCGGAQNKRMLSEGDTNFTAGTEGICGGGCMEQIHGPIAQSRCPDPSRPHYFSCSLGNSGENIQALPPQPISDYDCTGSVGNFCCAKNQ